MLLNEATASAARIPIEMVDEDSGAYTASLTFSGAEVQISINGGAWANALGTVVEVGGAGNGAGSYYYPTDATERAARGYIELKVIKTGYKPWRYLEPIEVIPTTTEIAAAVPTANQVRDAILGYTYRTGRTVRGLLRRLGASLEKATGLLGTNAAFYKPDNSAEWSVAQDPVLGTRGTVDLGDTETP